TGELRWSFDPLPDSPTHPASGAWRSEQAAETGGANAWTVMTVDPERGIVYVPTGSASPDFYGGQRLGDGRFANSVLALEAATGKLVWHQQLVHHDLWDFDLAAPPALVEMEDRKSTRLNSSHVKISYAVFCLKKKSNNVASS